MPSLQNQHIRSQQQQNQYSYKYRQNLALNDIYLYPFTIVWTILPCFTWLCPWIGHVGICNEQGMIHDFGGYHINKGKMLFSDPYKIVKLHIKPQQFSKYSSALQQATGEYQQQGHNLCCNNCHHYVARVLQLFEYQNKTKWTQVDIWWMCLYSSKYLDWMGIVYVYLPFVVISAGVLLAVLLAKVQY